MYNVAIKCVLIMCVGIHVLKTYLLELMEECIKCGSMLNH